MKRSGSVTVFLALALTCCCALILALTESARTAGARFYVRTMADSAIDSFFSRYHKSLWQYYRLLGREEKDAGESTQDLENFMKPYVENCGWYAVTSPDVTIPEKTYLTEDSGVWFEQEVKDYMKYGWINLNFTPASAEALWKEIHEAQVMDSIIADYGLNSRQAVAMEKALMKVKKNVGDQESLKEKAHSLLEDGDNASFQSAADSLSSKASKLPDLIEKYNQKADEFGAELARIEESHREEMEALSPANRQTVENQILSAREYTDADGRRRLEVNALDDNNPYELETIEDVKELAQQTADFIAEMVDEDDEDGDDVDEDALWAEVAEAWDEVLIPQMNVSHGIAEEETEGLLESILDLVTDDNLKIVMPPDRSIPGNRIDTSDFPSKTDAPQESRGFSGPRHGENSGGADPGGVDSGGVNPGTADSDNAGAADPGGSGSGSPDNSGSGSGGTALPLEAAGDLVTAAAVIEYMGQYLPCFTDNAQGSITCQLEYALAGKSSERKNLASAVNQILAIRIALNFIYIMATPELKEQARAMAEAVSAVSCIPALGVLVECLIIAAWARAESFMDLRLLLEGKKSAIYKTRDTWMTALPDVLSFAVTHNLAEEKLREAPAGIRYETYLKFLLLTKTPVQRDYRTMDMIQATLAEKEPDFRMRNLIYGMHARVSCESKHLFTALGIAASPGIPDGSFRIQAETVKAY